MYPGVSFSQFTQLFIKANGSGKTPYNENDNDYLFPISNKSAINPVNNESTPNAQNAFSELTNKKVASGKEADNIAKEFNIEDGKDNITKQKGKDGNEYWQRPDGEGGCEYYKAFVGDDGSSNFVRTHINSSGEINYYLYTENDKKSIEDSNIEPAQIPASNNVETAPSTSELPDDLQTYLKLGEKYQDYFNEVGITDKYDKLNIIQYASTSANGILNMSYPLKLNYVIESAYSVAKKNLSEEIKEITGKKTPANDALINDIVNIDDKTIKNLMKNDFDFYDKSLKEQLGYSEDETTQMLADYKKNCNSLYEKLSNGEITQKEFISKYKELEFDINSLSAKKQIDVAFIDNKSEITYKALLSDGVIDPSRQQNNGDCQVLSILNSMSRTDWGSKAIKDSIKYDDKGNVTVTLKGVESKDNQFTFTMDEISNAQAKGWAALGDADTVAIELALKKYSGIAPSDDLNPFTFNSNSKIGELPQLFCGKNAIKQMSIDKQDAEKAIKKYGNSAAITCSFKGRIQQCVPDEYKAYFSNMHAYSVKGITQENGKEYVTVVNPWYSEDEIKINLKDFNDVVNGLTVCIPQK